MMLRWMIALALVAAPVGAQEAEKEVPLDEGEASRDLSAPPGRIARGERDAPAVFVRLREGGVVQVKTGEEWKDATLDDVAKTLKSFADEQDREMKKSGKSAYEDVPGGMKVSRLFVSIDAEPTIPWQNVQWLMTIAAEQKYPKLEFTEGTRKMLVFLPVDRGINPAPREPPMEIMISVHAVARMEKQGKWGDAAVLRPVDVRYKLGNAHEETSTPAAVAEYVNKAWAAVKDTPNCTINGEIRAGNKVPFSNVFDLLETFEKAGLANMSFYGWQIPPPAVRTAARLPYPLKNYDSDTRD